MQESSPWSYESSLNICPILLMMAPFWVLLIMALLWHIMAPLLLGHRQSLAPCKYWNLGRPPFFVALAGHV